MDKTADAYRTISEAAEELSLPQHVLRFWETRFPQIKPLKRGGGRRFYRPDDIVLLRAIQQLLYAQGYTIKGVQRILKEQGIRTLVDACRTSTETGLPLAPAMPTEGFEQDGSDFSPEESEREISVSGAFSSVRAQEIEPERSEDDKARARTINQMELSPNSLLETHKQKLKAISAELLECQQILQNLR
jgi:DNA-binding transcriptional MerR regulator